MEGFGLVLFFIAAATANDRIVFPDEAGRMTQSGNRYYPSNRPDFSRNPYNYYQTAPPPGPPISPMITYPEMYPSKTYDVQPTPLATLANMLPPFWRNHVNNIISRGVAKFSLDMDSAICDTSVTRAQDFEKNVIFSPLSLAGTMALVLLASGGATFDEVVKILGLQSGVDISRHSELVHQMFGSLIEQINMRRKPGEPVANYASGIFVQNDYPIRPEFKEISEKVYKSEVLNLNFRSRPRQAQDAINQWVRNKTYGKISNILPYPPNMYTKVILASALYFNGEWNQYFFEFATKRKPFFIEPGKAVDVDMMYNGGEFPFYEDKRLGAKILGLPYKGREVTMYIIQPSAEGVTALKQFKRSLTPEILDGLINNMVNESCIIALPRMKLSSTLSLKDALVNLGLVSLFDPQNADLSLLSPGSEYPNPNNNDISSRIGDDEDDTTMEPIKKNIIKYITDNYAVEQWATGFRLRRLHKRSPRELFKRQVRQSRPMDEAFLEFINSLSFPTYGLDDLRNSHTTVNPGLFADDVLHKVEININERGTEAAAATAVTITKSGDKKKLIANRPFLFFIRHDPSKLIWFWGTVNKPEPHYKAQN